MELVVFFLIIVWIVPIFVCHYMAKEKGRDPGGWVVLSIFLGWIAVLIIACSQDSMKKTLSDQAELERLRTLQRAQDEKRANERVD